MIDAVTPHQLFCIGENDVVVDTAEQTLSFAIGPCESVVDAPEVIAPLHFNFKGVSYLDAPQPVGLGSYRIGYQLRFKAWRLA